MSRANYSRGQDNEQTLAFFKGRTCHTKLHYFLIRFLLYKLKGKIKGDLRTICRFSYMKVFKLITLGTKFKTLLKLGGKITMFSKFITNYIEQG